MNSNRRNLLYYIIMGLAGVIFLITGFITRNNSVISNRMIRSGITMLGIVIIFFLVTYKVQNNEKKDKDLQRRNKAMFDERNQLIVAKSNSFTLDVMITFSLVAALVFGSLGMNNYVYLIAGYIVTASILRVGVSIYFRHRF